MCGWKAPQVLLCAHSPQLVWVDVDPGWEAAAARDKAQEAAPVLWVKEEKINLTPALVVREVLQLVSRLKSCPKAMQAALCPLLTIGEIVQSLPKVLHACVRRFKVLEPSWRGQGKNPSSGLIPLVLQSRPFSFTALSPRTH